MKDFAKLNKAIELFKSGMSQRKLAQLHHPDHGGDAAEYKRYNAAYQRTKKAANG